MSCRFVRRYDELEKEGTLKKKSDQALDAMSMKINTLTAEVNPFILSVEVLS